MLEIVSDPVPLRIWEGGTVRVGPTRVSLDSVIYAYKRGESPEKIIDSFDTLELADVYAVIAYYLRHADQVDAYLDQRQHEAAEMRKRMEDMFDTRNLRERMLARRAAAQHRS